jgi:hypothetical protein
MTEYILVALLLGVGVPLILWREPIARAYYALGVSIAWWNADRQMRAFMREREREAEKLAKADLARAALKAAGERRNAVDLVT